jgi:hypothetical protein
LIYFLLECYSCAGRGDDKENRNLNMAKKEKTLRAKEAVEVFGRSHQTIRTWLKQGRFAGAYLEETPLGSFWLIPSSAVESFESKKVGRPPKPESELKHKRRTPKSQEN